MKRVLKKLITLLLIMIILNNFLCSNYTYAADSIINEAGKLVIEAIQDVLGTVIGILAILPKIVALAIGAAINALTAAVAYSELPAISPFDIIFGKVALVDIDFFNINDDVSIIMSIRAGVAKLVLYNENYCFCNIISNTNICWYTNGNINCS